MARAFDELNALSTEQELIDIEEFFGDMDLTKDQIKERVDFAKEAKEFLLFIFAYLMLQYKNGGADYAMANSEFVQDYRGLIHKRMPLDQSLMDYTMNIADDTLNTTQRRLAMEIGDTFDKNKVLEIVTNSYYLSEARAVEMAVNMSLDVINYKDFVTAVERGFKHKKWISRADVKVRKTHQKADGQIVPIGEYFHVGKARLAFPHDIITDGSTGADHLEEIINCRCSFRYVR